jgi:DNA (cytosine-5)-methyltransferase 1
MRTAVKQGKRRVPRPAAGLFDELIVDNFAGGGGASLGIERAVGRAVDVAVNHDRAAIEMHTANHPHTRHFCEDVWKVDPREATGGRLVGLAWFSPDCKHFSRAKGAKPVEKKIRGLAWVAAKWAKRVRPRVIILENVREFEDWGPLIHLRIDGKPQHTANGDLVMVPDKGRKGLTFKRFVGSFRSLGYHVEWRNLNAADYGAPTHRRRLFLIARCDGKPIRWPAHTHGKGRKPYRTAAECIDWSLPCPSIFDRKKPLAEKTMRRIAMGLKRYVLENPKPFIVRFHGDSKDGTPRWGQNHVDIDGPLPTQTASKDFAVVVPHLVQRNGEREGQAPRAQSVERPINTVTPGNNSGMLVSAYLAKHYGGDRGNCAGRAIGADGPIGTVTTSDHHALVTAYLAETGNANGNGDYTRPVDRPNNTQTSKAKDLLVEAWLVKHFGGVVGRPIDEPLPTTTARGTQNQVACAYLARFNHGEKQWNGVEDPLGTITSQGNKFALVYAFFVKYFATAIGCPVDEPMHTSTTKPRFGLVQVTIEGVPYVIADIGMRMLTPRELARAQGFPDDYRLTGNKANQVARIGNSVCPVMSEVLVRANLMEAA